MYSNTQLSLNFPLFFLILTWYLEPDKGITKIMFRWGSTVPSGPFPCHTSSDLFPYSSYLFPFFGDFSDHCWRLIQQLFWQPSNRHLPRSVCLLPIYTNLVGTSLSEASHTPTSHFSIKPNNSLDQGMVARPTSVQVVLCTWWSPLPCNHNPGFWTRSNLFLEVPLL